MNKNNRIIRLAAAGLMLTCAVSAWGIPAKRGVLTLTQPDGSELQVTLEGDESGHIYRTADGYPLVECGDALHYAVVDPSTGALTASPMAATDTSRRDAAARRLLQGVDSEAVAVKLTERRSARRAAKAGPGLFEGTSFPAKGEQKALVILVEYTDVKVKTPDAHNHFSRMLNEEGFADNGATGSARDFFVFNSAGQFTPQFDLYGPITLSQPMSYYGGNTFAGDDRHPEEMVIEACRALDGEVDFSQYDRDGDGFIDNVFVFYAGLGENAGGGANTVWPHSADIIDMDNTPHMFDGVRLNRYACTNEWNRTEPDGIGTFIHEFSHVLGLPDLYATQASSKAFTPGAWSTLDYGPYNNNSRTPPHYSAFERYALGWIEPKVIDRASDITLKSLAGNEACIIHTEKADEYFLLENRQQEGWDTYLPGHGMLVWHIDYNASVWTRNAVNNAASHQYVDLEEADGVQSEYDRDGDAFPGASNITRFTDSTYPSMKTWLNKSLGLPITDIAETDGIITFKVAGGRPAPAAPTALAATDITPISFTANWNTVDDAESYLLTVEQHNADGTFSALPGYSRHDAGLNTSLAVTGLKGETAYRYFVEGKNSAGTGKASESIEVTTPVTTFEYLAPTALPATVGKNSFTARWEELEGAESYILDVYYKRRGKAQSEVCDFTEGLAALGGWSTDSRTTDSRTSYVGARAPSLRMTDNRIESPVMSDDIHSLRFWHRGSSTTDANSIVVSACGLDGAWSEAAAFPVTTAAGGETLTVKYLPLHTRAVRIAHSRQGGGTLFIDDITLSWGGEQTTEPLAGYEHRNVGMATSATIENVADDAIVYYTVTGVSGGATSLQSNEIEVLMSANAGIVQMPAAVEAAIRIEGRSIIIDAEFVQARVFDTLGRTVATASAGEQLPALPAAGIYIVTVDGQAFKVAVK